MTDYQKAFTSICFSTDGTCVLCGGNSKYICLYEISQQLLLRKFTISQNRSLDGILEYLNNKNMTEAGPLDLIDHPDSDEEEDKNAIKVPGSTRANGKRTTKPAIRCKSIQFSPSSRSFAAATTEGCMVYSIDDILGTNAMFDPFQLGIEVTPEAVKEACVKKEFLRALTLSLRLNEQEIKCYVFNSIPTKEIKPIVVNLPLFFILPFLDFLATQFETSVFFEVCLLWWTHISFAFAEHLRSLGTSAQPSLRAIHKALAKHSEDLIKTSSLNQHRLEYLKNVAQLNKLKQERKMAENMSVE